MRRVLLDTDVYIEWLNTGERADVVLGPDLVRHMSTVVMMELEAGATSLAARRAVGQLWRAFEQTKRLLAPSPAAWKRAGSVLRALRSRGREIRRSSLVHDVLIALTARDIGATLLTSDVSDFDAIKRIVDFSFEVV